MKTRKYFEHHRLSVIVGVVMAALLVIGLAIIIPLSLRNGSPATTPKLTPTTSIVSPTASTGVVTPTVTPATTPTPTASPRENTPTAEPGIVWGPQACPAGIGSPAHWDAILGTRGSDSKVEGVSCANVLGNSTLQALVTVRHSDANRTLDVYVFTHITSTKPTQFFKLQGLLKGEALISGYNTVMTAQADQNSSVNAGKPVAQWTRDLSREYEWNAGKGTLVQVAFPGMYPDLTRYQAEVAQDKATLQQETWKLDAMKTAQKFVAQFLPTAPTDQSPQLQLVSGGGVHDLMARVNVIFSHGANFTRVTKITLTRLEGNVNGIWEVTAVQADWLSISSPKSGTATSISNPVTVSGFGPQFEAQIGVVQVLDHLYQPIGQAFAMAPGGDSPPTTFTVKVPYTSSFQTGAQEGIVELDHSSGAAFDRGVVFVKVLVNP